MVHVLRYSTDHTASNIPNATLYTKKNQQFKAFRISCSVMTLFIHQGFLKKVTLVL